jgi:deoxyribonuclease V
MLLKYRHAHPWTLSIAEAKAIQDELRHEVVIDDQLGNVDRIAGVDVGFDREQQLSRAGVAVLHFPSLELQEEITANDAIRFPYFPGLLSFREIPVILKALAQLTQIPRRLGIASHLGVITGLPTIGVAKKRLIGAHKAVPNHRGAWVELAHQGEVIGAVLRTRVGTKPLFVSPGHRITLRTSVSYVMQCTIRYRLPETTRHAHRLASQA